MLDREGVAGPADLAILGSEQQVADGVAALAEVGVTDFAAAEIGATADEREAIRAPRSASSSEPPSRAQGASALNGAAGRLRSTP